MVTDTRLLLIEGIKLAQKTFVAAKQVLGWAVENWTSSSSTRSAARTLRRS